MRLYDYKLSSDSDRSKWMETFKITSALGYFGGKQVIGKYLMNRLLNMAVKMEIDGKKPDIFIDAFTGGGKLGLSVPEGWFDTIVINDMDYGVASYFKCCKDNHKALIEMIEKLGENMNEAMFQFFVYNRCNSSPSKIKEMKGEYSTEAALISDGVVEPLLAGAMTYWVVQSEYYGCTAPGRASYSLNSQDKEEEKNKKGKEEKNKKGEEGGEEDTEKHKHEKEAIRNIISYAKKRIPKIHDIMNRRNIIVENLDYRDLIKKYNGKAYKDLNGTEHSGDGNMGKKNKLWYFDPPYHPATLSGGVEAPYMCSFPLKMVKEMTEILHNDKKDEYGELEYFIKSDYNPKYTYEQFYDNLSEAIIEEKKSRITKYKKQLKESRDAYYDFDMLEENDKNSTRYKGIDGDVVYYVECLGSFGKGVTDDENGGKLMGREYIWCRGNYQGEKSSTWKYDGTEQL